MRIALCAALAASAAALGGCTTYGSGYGGGWSAYDYNRPDPRYGGYYADRYQRRGDVYVLRRNDRVYRGRDGRYYCRRSDGTTGLIVGGIAGGALGAAIAPGGSEILGALIGGAAGAAIGNAVDRGEVRCR